jgi:hypothetical protein
VGLRRWLRGFRGRGPRLVGTSAGGSSLLEYGGGEFDQPRVGVTDESLAELAEQRDRVYESLFGKCDFVHHEMLPLVPHVDVYHFPPDGKRAFHTLVTAGMSDLPMNAPRQLGAAVRRAELVLYASEDRGEYRELLRRLAHFPHDNDTWLHWGHTMPNGTPPQPLFDFTALDTLFFMPTILRPDAQLGERLAWECEPVNLVWCVPISTAECALKLERGEDALYDLFQERQHPFVFDPGRGSYV